MNLSRPKGTGMACRDVSLIGVPTDIGASTRGASMGPEAMRVAGIRGALEGQGLVVHDLGDLHGPANPDRMPEQGYRHMAVDGGEARPGKHKATPILVADGAFDAGRVRAAFQAVSVSLPPEVAAYVARALDQYPVKK